MGMPGCSEVGVGVGVGVGAGVGVGVGAWVGGGVSVPEPMCVHTRAHTLVRV